MTNHAQINYKSTQLCIWVRRKEPDWREVPADSTDTQTWTETRPADDLQPLRNAARAGVQHQNVRLFMGSPEQQRK